MFKKPSVILSILLIATSTYAQNYTVERGSNEDIFTSGTRSGSNPDTFTGGHSNTIISPPKKIKNKENSDDKQQFWGGTVAAPPMKNYTIERIIDGETLMLTNGERVKFRGIKIPENEEMKSEVKGFLQMLKLEGKEVWLEFRSWDKKDENGHLLAYVYESICDDCKSDGHEGYEYAYKGNDNKLYLSINATLVKSGYAEMKFGGGGWEFQWQYQEAEENDRGLWKNSECNKDEDCQNISCEREEGYPSCVTAVLSRSCQCAPLIFMD